MRSTYRPHLKPVAEKHDGNKCGEFPKQGLFTSEYCIYAPQVGGRNGDPYKRHHAREFCLNFSPRSGKEHPAAVEEYDRTEYPGHILRPGEIRRRPFENLFHNIGIQHDGDSESKAYPKLSEKHLRRVTGMLPCRPVGRCVLF